MDKKNNFCTYETTEGKLMCSFNIYQARSGKICIAMADRAIELSRVQVHILAINVYVLKDFDIDLFIKAYAE